MKPTASERAREQLRHALKNQKTIRTSKLLWIINTLNISLEKSRHDQEVIYLKHQIKKLQRKLSVQGTQIKRLKEKLKKGEDNETKI